jgi:hypothetical protein
VRHTYLPIHDIILGTRFRVKMWADKSPLIITWRYDLPFCMYLVSESTAGELCQDLENVFGKRGRYLITEVSENRQGRLPAESWYLMRHKRRKPKKTG